MDGRVLWANLHLLFWLSLFPFVTGWVGESHFAPVPVTCYAGVALLAAVAYRVLTRVIIRSDTSNHLLADATGSDTKGTVSMVAYTLAVLAPLLGTCGPDVNGSGPPDRTCTHPRSADVPFTRRVTFILSRP